MNFRSASTTEGLRGRDAPGNSAIRQVSCGRRANERSKRSVANAQVNSP
jgi:hypothetical protein